MTNERKEKKGGTGRDEAETQFRNELPNLYRCGLRRDYRVRVCLVIFDIPLDKAKRRHFLAHFDEIALDLI